MIPPVLSAVLWDMDGTLVDSEPLWQAARDRLARRHGIEWTADDHQAAVGRPLADSAARMQERGMRLSIPEINETIVDDVVDAVASTTLWRPGALELLREARGAGVRNALVTLAFREVAEAVASRVGDGAWFDLIVAGDELVHSKPHPEPYLLALTRLNVSPDDCVAIEDTPSGVQSARAAGLQVVAVPYLSDLTSAAEEGVMISASLSDVHLDDLRNLLVTQK